MKHKNKKQWQMDHVVPCSFYDLSKAGDRKKFFNYKNIKPAWHNDYLINHAGDNKNKSHGYDWSKAIKMFDALPTICTKCGEFTINKYIKGSNGPEGNIYICSTCDAGYSPEDIGKVHLFMCGEMLKGKK